MFDEGYYIDRREEYQWVKQEFEKTMDESKHNIIKIERIQHPVSYAIYSKKKEEIDSRNPLDNNNEQYLFHGTTADRVENIVCNGFNRSYAGRNATMHGWGTYFAKNASYSHRYTDTGHARCRHMFLARVLTGVYTRGRSSMKTAPERDSTNHIEYDSTVDDEHSPTIFVVYYDDRAYPEYLITYS